MSLFETLIPAAISAASSIGGAIIGSSANKSATKKAVKAAEEANRIRQESIDKATAIYAQQQEQAAPAVRYLRDVISNPVTGLYPDQLAAQAESRRQSENQISRSGLRGSGRAVTASLKQVDSDFVNNALAQNRQSRQGAAGALAGQSFQAGSSAANALVRGADSEANTAENIGTMQGNSGTANAQLYGNALGDIGSLIASEVKGRSSSYDGLDIPGRNAYSDRGTVNPATGQFGHLAKGGVVKRGLSSVVSC